MGGLEYTLVHVTYTLPPAILLSLLLHPLKTSVDNYKIVYLLSIAVAATIPWDSFLLKNEVWSYPEHAVIGPTLWRIPIEELFFFVIQTYLTSLVAILVGKTIVPTAQLPILRSTAPLHPSKTLTPIEATHPFQNDYNSLKRTGLIGSVLISSFIVIGAQLVRGGGGGTYLGLILVWAGPVILLLWCLSHQYIISLPRKNVLIPIIAPTLYLWFVDTLALKNGTWVINPAKSLKIKLWGHLDIEEAIFFLVTNILVTFGQLAFDHTLAVLNGFPELFPVTIPSWPSVNLMLRALQTRVTDYPSQRVICLQHAVVKLKKKSRSFSLASSVFEGRLRLDLVILYSFCRNADDLVDEAASLVEARAAVSKLSQAVESAYRNKRASSELVKDAANRHKSASIAQFDLPEEMAESLDFLPLDILPLHPIQGLLDGFKMDLEFPPLAKSADDVSRFPIKEEKDLERYGYCVAGTVAELLLNLVFQHSPSVPARDREEIIQAGINMGIALQYINISRDIAKDAAIGRCYIPSSWLNEYNLTPIDVIENPNLPEIRILRKRLLEIALKIYFENRGAVERIPPAGGARKGVRAAVENYVEIGRVILEQDEETELATGEQATVSKSRRLWVFFKALFS